jgi:hypothetical protein
VADARVGSEIELLSDGAGLAVIGSSTDVERFLVDGGLDRVPSKALDVHRLGSLLGTGGAAVQVGSELAANSGRWVKLTADSAKAVKKYGLVTTKTRGVSYAMAGKPGDIQRWVQIAQGPGVLLGGPTALSALSTMMQQCALQQQMDEIVEYLQEISEKVDDILRSQKDAVVADMIGVDLIIEEALTVRDKVGRVSEITWSKLQTASMILARTQAYALRQLDAIAEKLEKATNLGEIARETSEAEPKVREWLSVLARTLQLQDGVSVLELDRVLDASPDELDRHRLGLVAARQSRLELITRSTAGLLTRMNTTVQTANSKVLLNPFDSPRVVRSSNLIATGVIDFRGRLGLESGHESTDAKPWGQAVIEARDKVLDAAADGAHAAKDFGNETFNRAAEVLRSAGLDGDGIPSKPRAAAAAEEAAASLKGAAAGVAGALGARFQRKRDSAVAEGHDLAPSDDESQQA